VIPPLFSSVTAAVFVFLTPIITSPFDFVLFILSYQADTLKDISYVIDATLLNLQPAYCIIEVNTLFRCILDKLDKLFGKLDKPILLS
jgi:hypothetical protein